MKKVGKEGLRRLVIRRVFIAAALGVLLILMSASGSRRLDASAAASGSQYVILASNDLGMHCMQDDYSRFMILPPANTLHVQVFRKGGEKARLVTTGISVEYSVNNNTTSSDKVNFWKYASKLGFTLAPDEGITGSRLSGKCVLSADGRYFEAKYIPVTPYNDKAKKTDPAFPFNPYQTVTINIRSSSTKELLATTSVVVLPVSTEMTCTACHGPGLEQDFLAVHDARQGTSLQASPAACASCHKDNALGAPGKPGIPSLSAAMHGFHADKISTHTLPDTNACYACHPGHVTQCLRGAMARQGFTCTDCHGELAAVGNPARDAWLEEPSCAAAGCHSALYQPAPGGLYRTSYLVNGPEEMNGKILCTSCHNSPHAEWVSTQAADNALPKSIYGKADYIRGCTACHGGSGKVHGGVSE